MFRRYCKIGALGAAGAGALMVGSAYAESPPVGVYLWGNNRHGLVETSEGNLNVKTPVRVPFLDGEKLRDLAVSSQVAAAVLKNGSVVQWTHPESHSVVLKGKNVKQVKASNGTLVALAGSGDLWTWNKDTKPQKFTFKDSLGWFEKVVDVQAGADHVACLTSRGRVLTAMLHKVDEHDGQLGQASLSAFDPAPAPLELRLVKLIPGKVAQIACGAQTTLFRLVSGDVYGCGSNKYGQLMLPYTVRNMRVSVPTLATTRLNGGLGPIVNIGAGGDVSFLQTADRCYVVGNGINGQFGTGSLAHCQPDPLQMPLLSGIQEFDEKLGKSQNVVPDTWSVSPTHCFVKLSGASPSWFVWGSNLYGELGTGGNAKLIRPTIVGQMDNIVANSSGDVFVAGDGVSGCFTKCT